MNVLLTLSHYATMVRLDPIDNYLDDENGGVPKGFEGVGNMITFITGAMIFVFMGIAVIMIIVSAGRAAYSDRHEIKDAKTPLFVFLILATIGGLLEVFFGVWSAVVNAA